MNQQLKPAAGFREVAIANRGGGGMLMPQTFGDVVSFSEIMARSQHAIPRHLRDVPGACLAVTMQALRWEMDPFAVASKSYNVKDIIAYEAQLIAAVVHTRAPIKTRPNYVYSGEGADRRCTVSAVFEDGVERSYESPRIGDITVKNSPLWKSDPDQQLGYFSIRSFARRYCPEVILGVYTPEEAETFRGPDNARDVTPKPSLADRLAASSGGDGFSQNHVIREIGGDTQGEDAVTQPTNSANTGGGHEVTAMAEAPDQTSSATVSHSSQVSSVATDTPASDPLAPNPADAGNLIQESSGGSPATDDGMQAGVVDKPGVGLPAGWQAIYADAMTAISDKPKSLATRRKEALQSIKGEPSDDDKAEMAAIEDLVKRRNSGELSPDAFKAALREIVPEGVEI